MIQGLHCSLDTNICYRYQLQMTRLMPTVADSAASEHVYQARARWSIG